MGRQLRSDKWANLSMRTGLGSFIQPNTERLRFIRQLGVRDVLMNFYRNALIDTGAGESPLPGEEKWEFQDLVRLRNRIEDHDLRLFAIENLPTPFYEKIMLGLPGKERQLENVKETLFNMGRAGIPVFGYGWMPSGVWRSSTTFPIRGGARAMRVRLEDFADAPLSHGRVFSESEMWEYYHEFLESIIPVAEEVGVTIALHPNDPPTPILGGVPQLFRSFDAFKKAMSLVPSDNHGLEFCLGNWSEMDQDIHEVIDYFGGDKLTYVHFQTVSGPIPDFNEVFVDDSAQYDPFRVISHLFKAGFNGMVMPGHVPQMESDGPWKERGRAFTIGYIQGLIDVTLAQAGKQRVRRRRE